MIYPHNTLTSQLPLHYKKRIGAVNVLTFLIAQLAIDLYIPSMPAMAVYFQTTQAMIQSTLTSFLLGYAIAPLFFGIVCDHWGRRPIKLMSLLIAFIAALGCISTSNIEWFLAYRFIQGIGMAGVMVSSRAIWRDLYDGAHLTRVIAVASTLWSLIPLIAPVAGGYVQHYLGWKMNFHILFATTGISLLISWKFMPETRHERPPEQINVKDAFSNYASILKNRQFLIFTLCIALISTIPAAYSTAGAFLLQTHLHLDATAYGWCTMFVGSGLMLGNLISGALIMRLGHRRLLMLAQILSVLISLGFITWAWLTFNVINIVLSTFAILFTSSLAYSIYSSQAMMPFKGRAASAGSVLTTVQLAGWAFGATFITFFKQASALPLAMLFFLALASTALLVFNWLRLNHESE